MRLELTPGARAHAESVMTLGWNGSGELVSLADDRSLQMWSKSGELLQKLEDMDRYAASLHWYPSLARQSSKEGEMFAVGCSDGSFMLCSASGRVEKVVEAHQGAVVSLRWNYEGNALATGGEDGAVKIWSKNGQLRSTLLHLDACVYGIVWGPDSESVLVITGKDVIIRPLHPAAKQLQWKAHDAPLLCVDWNPVNNRIVTGSEDGSYKVWDALGRILYVGEATKSSITSLRWAPDGNFFLVGSYNSVRLCDRAGWSAARNVIENGSVFSIDWTSDSTMFAVGCADGSVHFGQIVGKTLEWSNWIVTVENSNKIIANNILSEYFEEHEFRDRIVKVSLEYDYLLVAAGLQCHVYRTENLNTPAIFDLKDTLSLIVQSPHKFLTIDNASGVVVYSYDARSVSRIAYPGLRCDLLNSQCVSLSDDLVAILDRNDSKVIRTFDANSGKPLPVNLTHSCEIVEVKVDVHSNGPLRKLAFVDRNKDLYLVSVMQSEVHKLAPMVESFAWSTSTGMLCAITDSKLVVWYYPSCVNIDRDLLPRTRTSIADEHDLGQGAQILRFSDSRIQLRRSDGATITENVPPYAQVLYRYVSKNEWDNGVRLCRFVKEDSLWACLAAMSIQSRELNTAEVALAALGEIDKLQFIMYVKEIPTVEGRNAEISLYRRQVTEAEQILLQAGLSFRAIMMHIRRFSWERALEIAQKYNSSHVDTVLVHRQKYLNSIGRSETNPRFQRLTPEKQIEWSVIEEKMQLEIEKEAQRPNARPYE